MEKKPRTKICFVLVSLENGGTENYLLRFLKFINLEKYEVTVLCKGGSFGILEHEYRNLGVNLIKFKLGYIRLKSLMFLYKTIKDLDVVCDLTGNFAGLIMLVGKISNVPKRIAFYRASTNHFSNTPHKLLYNKLMNFFVKKFSTHILSNSNTAFENFFNQLYKKDKRFEVVRNGINCNDLQSYKTDLQCKVMHEIPLDKYIIGHVGRFNSAKNFPFIFQTASKLTEISKEFHFVFCGRGTDSEEFNKELEKYGIINMCTCLGSQNNIQDVYKTFNLFLFPSITEGQPNALIEAMIVGIPFIASKISPIIESIPENAINQLVSIENTEEAIDLILKIKSLDSNTTKLEHRDWAIQMFDASKRFKQFENILLN